MRHIAAFVLLVSGLNRDKLTEPSALKLKEVGDSNRAKCRKIKCPSVEDLVCVKLKSKNGNTPKNISIIVINKCELEYMKCHEGLEAVVVPMKHCDHKHPSETPTKPGSKRVKRSPTIATGTSQDNKIAPKVARKRVATKESPRIEYRSLYFGPKSRKDADEEEDAEAEAGSDAQRDLATETAEANLDTEQNGETPEKISLPTDANYDGGNKEKPPDNDDDRKVQPLGGGVNINIELVEDPQRIDEEDKQGIEEENNGQYEGAVEEENTKDIVNEEADGEENVEENDDSDNEARGLKNTEQSNGDQDPVKIKAPMVQVNFIVNKDERDELAADEAHINNPEETQPKSAEAEQVGTEKETEAAPELATDGANTSDRDETQPKTTDTEEVGSEREDQIEIKITPEGEDPQKEEQATQEEGEDIQGNAVADDGDGKNADMEVENPSAENDAPADPSNVQDQQPPGDDFYVTDKPPDYEDVDLDEYKSDCPTVCPARDVMLCARCKEGVYRTFMSACHMRMFNCKHPEEKLELVSRKPCMLSAPFLNEMPKARGRVGERRDADPVLHYLMCRTKSGSDDPDCRSVGTTDATEIK